MLQKEKIVHCFPPHGMLTAIKKLCTSMPKGRLHFHNLPLLKLFTANINTNSSPCFSNYRYYEYQCHTYCIHHPFLETYMHVQSRPSLQVSQDLYIPQKHRPQSRPRTQLLETPCSKIPTDPISTARHQRHY